MTLRYMSLCHPFDIEALCLYVIFFPEGTCQSDPLVWLYDYRPTLVSPFLLDIIIIINRGLQCKVWRE